VVSEVARRHDVSPKHLIVWHKAARAGQLILPVDDALLAVLGVARLAQIAATENFCSIYFILGVAVALVKEA
jgi:transposase